MCDAGLLWKCDAQDADAAFHERDRFLETVRAHDGWKLDDQAAKHIFTELLSNVMRYGRSPVSVWIHCWDRQCKFHILEFGHGFQDEPCLPETLSEGGRGLFLVSAFAVEMKIAGDPRGTHIIATLPPES